MNEMVEMKYIILLAVQYAISFSIFGWIARGWREEDIKNNRDGVLKHYWKKWKIIRKKNNDWI